MEFRLRTGLNAFLVTKRDVEKESPGQDDQVYIMYLMPVLFVQAINNSFCINAYISAKGL